MKLAWNLCNFKFVYLNSCWWFLKDILDRQIIINDSVIDQIVNCWCYKVGWVNKNGPTPINPNLSLTYLFYFTFSLSIDDPFFISKCCMKNKFNFTHNLPHNLSSSLLQFNSIVHPVPSLIRDRVSKLNQSFSRFERNYPRSKKKPRTIVRKKEKKKLVFIYTKDWVTFQITGSIKFVEAPKNLEEMLPHPDAKEEKRGRTVSSIRPRALPYFS